MIRKRVLSGWLLEKPDPLMSPVERFVWGRSAHSLISLRIDPKFIAAPAQTQLFGASICRTTSDHLGELHCSPAAPRR